MAQLQEKLAPSKKPAKTTHEADSTSQSRLAESGSVVTSSSSLHFKDIEAELARSEHSWPDVATTRGASLAELMRQESELAVEDDVRDATARKQRTLSTSSSVSHASRGRGLSLSSNEAGDDVTPLVTHEVVFGLDDVTVSLSNGDVTDEQRQVTAL